MKNAPCLIMLYQHNKDMTTSHFNIPIIPKLHGSCVYGLVDCHVGSTFIVILVVSVEWVRWGSCKGDRSQSGSFS